MPARCSKRMSRPAPDDADHEPSGIAPFCHERPGAGHAEREDEFGQAFHEAAPCYAGVDRPSEARDEQHDHRRHHRRFARREQGAIAGAEGRRDAPPAGPHHWPAAPPRLEPPVPTCWPPPSGSAGRRPACKPPARARILAIAGTSERRRARAVGAGRSDRVRDRAASEDSPTLIMPLSGVGMAIRHPRTSGTAFLCLADLRASMPARFGTRGSGSGLTTYRPGRPCAHPMVRVVEI